MTHDYKRNGTTTLFAALNVLDGQVIGQCQQRHTHTEWLKFLRKIDRETPKDKTLHLIADNYATHKHPAVQEWLAKHPRFNMHFTPTSASWLNMVERFIRRSSGALRAAIGGPYTRPVCRRKVTTKGLHVATNPSIFLAPPTWDRTRDLQINRQRMARSTGSRQLLSTSFPPVPRPHSFGIPPQTAMSLSGGLFGIGVPEPIIDRLLLRIGLIVPRQARGHLLEPGVSAVHQHPADGAPVAVLLVGVDHHLAAGHQRGQVLP